ncbi:lamin tail domain-containing protein [Nonomuraea muscovyensis]|jgi:hypothetical protein|uniref:LTD domain-containing protein n=1 Tax=Nonomuraea muscovyensis TaxID=1124761 RepID=A0A7X0CAF9_9ACTN|nr:lamin tail domain-containing protein [Nonomuraea muscovyensis]MBB6350051.1 hypothetical protein [Nonomuraea muscovyensis]MDF2705329.1 lamin tail protein [Nonomuraea muscovyensis]
MRLNRRAILAAGTAAAALLALTPAARAAAPAVQFTKVHYDSPGSDRGGNASLNGEYAVLKNTTRAPIQLEKWILRDKNGFKYRFPRFTLRPGRSVTVRSGKGTDTSTVLYWGRGWYVWNNTGDTAGVYRAADLKKIDTCSWGRSSRAYVTC